jgi:serine/threonine-protein phosphatase 6 regulatory ankyrin repeat subunit B
MAQTSEETNPADNGTDLLLSSIYSVTLTLCSPRPPLTPLMSFQLAMTESILAELELLLAIFQKEGKIKEHSALFLTSYYGAVTMFATVQEGAWRACEPVTVLGINPPEIETTLMASIRAIQCQVSPLFELEQLAMKYPALDRIVYESSWFKRRNKRAAPALNEFYKGQTPLHEIIRDPTIESKEKKHLVSLLIKAGANVNILDEDEGHTALHRAVEGNYLKIVKLLLAAHANIATITRGDLRKLPVQMASPSNPIWALLMEQHGTIFMEEIRRLQDQLASLKAIEHSLVSLELSSAANVPGTSTQQASISPVTISKLSSPNLPMTQTAPLSLHHAVATKDVELAKQLLTLSTTNINETIEDTWRGTSYLKTPLYVAIMLRDMNMIRLLLEHGAKASRDPDGCSLVYVAAALRSKDIMQLLLLYGVKAHMGKKDDRTPRQREMSKSWFDNSEELYLLENKNYFLNTIKVLKQEISVQQRRIDLLQQNKVLQQQVKNLSHFSCHNEKNKTCDVSQLTDSEPLLLGDLNKFRESETPLHDILRDSAIDSKNKKHLVSLLITDRSILDVLDAHGNTAIHLAAKCDAFEIAELLVKGGANTEIVNKNHHLAVHLAKRNSRTWGLLLEANSIIFTKEIRRLQGLIKSIEENVKSSAPNTSTPIAVFSAYPTSSSMVEKGPSKNEIFSGSGEDSDDSKEYLDDRDSSREYHPAPTIETTTQTFFGKSPGLLALQNSTPLHYSVETNNKEAAKTLLAQGINIEAVTIFSLFFKITALGLAVYHNNSTMVKLLLKNGALTDHSRFTYNRTLLHWACQNPSKEIIELLLFYKANTYQRDNFHYLPIDLLPRNSVIYNLMSNRSYFRSKIKALKQEISTLEQLAPLMKEQHALQEQVRELEAEFASNSKKQSLPLGLTM